MNVYGRTRPERLAETVERMAEKLIPSPEHVPSMYKQAVGAETENATPSDSKELRLNKLAPAVGLESDSPTSCGTTLSEQKPHKAKHSKALPESPSPVPEQKPALPEHAEGVSGHAQVVPRLYQNQPVMPTDLVQVVEAWNHLPDVVKAGILVMVNASK